MKLITPPMKRARIEIIPMIDTIFFLLVFFMITSLSMVRMKALPMTLPKSVSPSAPSAGTAQSHLMILTVSDTGGYFLGEQPVAPAALGAALEARAKTDPDAVVVLNISPSQTAQALIKTLDVVNRVRTPGGKPLTALLATEPVDGSGRRKVSLP